MVFRKVNFKQSCLMNSERFGKPASIWKILINLEYHLLWFRNVITQGKYFQYDWSSLLFIDFFAVIEMTKLVEAETFQQEPLSMLEYVIQPNLIFIFVLMLEFRYH